MQLLKKRLSQFKRGEIQVCIMRYYALLGNKSRCHVSFKNYDRLIVVIINMYYMLHCLHSAWFLDGIASTLV